jgi:hypothetical protein
MGREHVALVIGAEDKVRVLDHVHGEEVEDEVEEDDLGEAVADEFAGCVVALVAASADFGDGDDVDFVAVGDLEGDLGAREGGDGPVPAFSSFERLDMLVCW